MQILIWDGNPNPDDINFETYMANLIKHLSDKGNRVKRLILREKDINFCCGCFGCWLKTPGKCIFRDDMDEILRAYLESRIVLFVSPISMGYPSYLIKRSQDRLLPILLPHFIIKANEFHHQKRYSQYPDFGLILQLEEDTDSTDLEIIDRIYRRFSLNCHGKHLFTFTSVISAKEVANEICHI